MKLDPVDTTSEVLDGLYVAKIQPADITVNDALKTVVSHIKGIPGVDRKTLDTIVESARARYTAT